MQQEVMRVRRRPLICSAIAVEEKGKGSTADVFSVPETAQQGKSKEEVQEAEDDFHSRVHKYMF